MRRVLTIAALALVLMVGASAQPPLNPPLRLDLPEDISMHGYGDSDKACASWTDGCMTCRRGVSGDPICPNIGISCQPQKIRCVRKAGEPDPDAPKPDIPKTESPTPEPPKAEPPKTEPTK
jgi:hypothetical protein